MRASIRPGTRHLQAYRDNLAGRIAELERSIPQREKNVAESCSLDVLNPDGAKGKWAVRATVVGNYLLFMICDTDQRILADERSDLEHLRELQRQMGEAP